MQDDMWTLIVNDMQDQRMHNLHDLVYKICCIDSKSHVSSYKIDKNLAVPSCVFIPVGQMINVLCGLI